MKGQKIHNAEATSQHPPVASWCESSALKLVKCEGERVCQRDKKGDSHVASAEIYVPGHRPNHEHSHVRPTVSEAPGQPTFVSAARIDNC